MIELSLTSLLAAWGALLSTVLGAIKIVEFKRTFTKLETTWVLRGDEYEGNDVLLINRSSSPVLIIHFDIVRAKRTGLKWQVTRTEFSLEDSHVNIRIEPHAAHSLTFSEGDHFDWSWRLIENFGKLYFRVWLAGRKQPLWLEIGS
jgi:hypothetical protein